MLEAYGRYFQFHGRADRGEYWWFIVTFLLLALLATLIDEFVFGGAFDQFGDVAGIALPVVILASLVPSIAVTVRRLHDLERSGWWCLLGLVPLIGQLIVFIWMVSPGTPGPNRYGKEPRYTDARWQTSTTPRWSLPNTGHIPTTAPAAQGTGELIDQLEKAARLHAEGTINDDEFKLLKDALLRE